MQNNGAKDMLSVVLKTVIWVVFMLDICYRFLPFTKESMGARKYMAANYLPAKHSFIPEQQRIHNRQAVIRMLLICLVVEVIIGILFFLNIIDKTILLLIALLFSIVDIFAANVFCPFHAWVFKSRCCITCRVYCWDFAMIFMPFIFAFDLWSQSLLWTSLILLIRWELAYKRHPEFFFPESNAALRCGKCTEKHCRHKLSFHNRQMLPPGR